MGTETVFQITHNYYRIYIVKLNNPLMGTETFNIIHGFIFIFSVFVKLNNPLMGTETCICIVVVNNILLTVMVKLNNPLMGTETKQIP